MSAFGDLILHDTFQVLKSDAEREYLVYLFQKIILCCKEVGPTGKQSKEKVNKSNSMIRKSAGSGTTPGGTGSNGSGSRRKPPLQLKGRIFINNVIHALPGNKPSRFSRTIGRN